MNSSLLPRIRVHSWGGLGSQLFAWALIEDVLIKFPNRRISLILHSGGVTKRQSELDFLSKDFKIYRVDDFSFPDNPIFNDTKLQTSFFKRRIKTFLKLLGVFANSNTNEEFSQLKPWIFVIRGHYSHRSITNRNIEMMLNRERFREKFKEQKNSKRVSIHYRLGDLLHLDSKTFISSKRINNLIEKNKIGQNSPISVFSDSPKTACELLRVEGKAIYFEEPRMNTLEVISNCVYSSIFIGTSSKVSFWIILFRNYFGFSNSNYLPLEQKIYFKILLLEIQKNSALNFY